jgi:predicted anti-sigma-YlaC factor YlaD
MAEVAGMTCQELVELVTDYLEDALDPETRDRFEEHRALCPGCETYLQQMAETATRLGEIPVETLSREAQAVLLTAFRDVRGGRTPT